MNISASIEGSIHVVSTAQLKIVPDSLVFEKNRVSRRHRSVLRVFVLRYKVIMHLQFACAATASNSSVLLRLKRKLALRPLLFLPIQPCAFAWVCVLLRKKCVVQAFTVNSALFDHNQFASNSNFPARPAAPMRSFIPLLVVPG